MKTKSGSNEVHSVVDKFAEQYYKEFDFYSAVSDLSAQLIESKLVSKGIRAIVTSRAKNPSRLYDKLKKRDPEKKYNTSDDIYSDIVDLAGVRIALYFNSELSEIDQIINDLFDIRELKKFPTESKSQGYKAIHYRCSLKIAELTEQQKRYSKAYVEIQIASLLMHAWAEVEHDIVYKPLQGKISEEEKKALEELNAIVLEGEKVLEKLQQAAIKRKTLNDQYDVYNFLVQYISEKYDVDEEKIPIGDTRKLFDYLLENKFDTQLKLKNRIKDLHVIIDENWTLSDQIIDHIVGNDRRSLSSYFKIKPFKNLITSESAIGSFLLSWIELEKLLKNNKMGTSNKDTFVRLKSLVFFGLLSEEEYEEIYVIRNIRNNLVHGLETPDNDYLEWNTQKIKQLIENLRNKIENSDVLKSSENES